MKKDIKKIIFIIIGFIILVTILICFTIALNNNKTKPIDEVESNNITASEISEEYESINYGTESEVAGADELEITEGGNYNLTGNYSCITINTTESVQLNMNNVLIDCKSGPAINVIAAKNVSITLTGTNKVEATTTEELNGAIYSKSDLIFSGTGTLEVTSNYDGIVSKDSLIINSGTYIINTLDDGIKGRDNVAIVDGSFTINAKGGGIKSTNEDDSSMGYVAIDGGTFKINSVNDAIEAETKLIIKDGTFNLTTTGNANSVSAKGLKADVLVEVNGGTFTINTTDDGIHANGNVTINKGEINVTSKDDAIHADGKVEINNGTLTLIAGEGIEATYVKINNGVINITASDDGINAGNKSKDYTVTIEINGGNITIKMGQGDTDGIDSNGNLYINGGTINITGNSPFDYDGEAKYTGGTIIVNGVTTNSITNQMMGGRGGGPGGNQRYGKVR